MTYTINGMNLSEYGIIPCRGNDSNLALCGWLNLPPRLGETYHEWAEEDGVEPYVLSDEIFFTGLDLTFTGLIKGTKERCAEKIQMLVNEINSMPGTFVLSCPLGDFDVYLKSLTTRQSSNLCEITIIFHQPVIPFPVLTLPVATLAKNTINGMAFPSFGLTLFTSPDYDLGDLRAQDLTIYGAELHKKVKRGPRKITLECILSAKTLTEFIQRGRLLRKLFSDPGLKDVKLGGRIYSAFAVDGFEITGINIYGNAVIAEFKIQLILYTDLTI